MMAKMSSNSASEVRAGQPTSTSSSNQPVATPRRGVIRYIRRPHSAHKRKGDGAQRKVLSIANGGLVPVLAALRGARKKRSEAKKKVGKDETSGFGMFGNLSFRITENRNDQGADESMAEGGMALLR